MFRAAATILSATLIVVSLQIVAPSASAQIGNIFSNSSPRPPAGLRGNHDADDVMQEPDEEDVPNIPPGRLLPAPSRPLPPGQGAPPPGAVQSQPLAPPPGTKPSGVAANPPSAAHPLPPGEKLPSGNPVQSPATLQPGDEIVTEPPAVKIANRKAVFAGLDKITGRVIKFDEDIGETVQFGALRVKTDACYTRPATEAANTDAFVEVDEITLQNEVKRIFSGWMFASSPGLHAVEHPIYDVWLTDCKSPIDQPVTAQNAPKTVQPAGPAPQPHRPKARASSPGSAPNQRPAQAVPPPGFSR